MDKEQETQNAKDIALIKQEIGYLREDTKDIKSSLKILLENYITRKDVEGMFERVHAEIDGRIGGLNSRMENKVDKVDFKELEKLVEDHIAGGNIKWGAVTQSIITTLLTGAILAALMIAFQSGKI
jgi:predicted RND superfamily exporter protein